MAQDEKKPEGAKGRKSDLARIIRDLNTERTRISRIIESLETIARDSEARFKPPSRRGRKFMDAAGRLEVSERMRRYWARKRGEKENKQDMQSRQAEDSQPERDGVERIALLAEAVERAAYVSA